MFARAASIKSAHKCASLARCRVDALQKKDVGARAARTGAGKRGQRGKQVYYIFIPLSACMLTFDPHKVLTLVGRVGRLMA